MAGEGGARLLLGHLVALHEQRDQAHALDRHAVLHVAHLAGPRLAHRAPTFLASSYLGGTAPTTAECKRPVPLLW